MQIRRVVTGQLPSGKSVFVSDGSPPRTTDFKHVPGFAVGLVWETSAASQLPISGNDPTPQSTSWHPPVGGTSVQLVQFPPDSVMGSPSFDPAAAGQEYLTTLPGLAERFEQDNPGMHTTDSVDYGVVLEGEICLELDDNQVKVLHPSDVVVQNGTRHAWRNRSDKPAKVLFVLTGTRRR